MWFRDLCIHEFVFLSLRSNLPIENKLFEKKYYLVYIDCFVSKLIHNTINIRCRSTIKIKEHTQSSLIIVMHDYFLIHNRNFNRNKRKKNENASSQVFSNAIYKKKHLCRISFHFLSFFLSFFLLCCSLLRKKNESYSFEDSRHLWWYTICMLKVYNTNKIEISRTNRDTKVVWIQRANSWYCLRSKWLTFFLLIINFNFLGDIWSVFKVNEKERKRENH